MTLTDKINADIKAAMLAKEALRSVKAALLLASTEKGASGDVSEEAGLKTLQKLVKQRKEAADIYQSQGRADLAEVENFQAGIIEKYLPAQMNEQEVTEVVKKAIADTGATSPADTGKVMGAVMKQLAGKADGKMISSVVKQLLG
jgi:uncharacterized protein